MVFDWSNLGCSVPDPNDPSKPIAKDFLEPFLTIPVKSKPFFFFYETFGTLGMKSGDITKVNGKAIGPNNGIPLDTEVYALTFREPIHVFKFLKYCETLLKYASVHSVIANLDFFVRGIIYPQNGKKNRGILTLPSKSAFCEIIAELFTQRNLPVRIQKLLQQESTAELVKELKTLRENHKHYYDLSTGTSPYGDVPIGHLLPTDCWLSPNLACSLFLNDNKKYLASGAQQNKFNNSRGLSFTLLGARMEGQKVRLNQLPSSSVFIASMAKNQIYTDEETVAQLHRNLNFAFRFKNCQLPAFKLSDHQQDIFNARYKSGVDIVSITRSLREDYQASVAALNNQQKASLNPVLKRLDNIENISERHDTEIAVNKIAIETNEEDSRIMKSIMVRANPAVLDHYPDVAKDVIAPESLGSAIKNHSENRKTVKNLRKKISEGYRFSLNDLPNLQTDKMDIPSLNDKGPPMASIMDNRPFATTIGIPSHLAASANGSEFKTIMGSGLDQQRMKVRSSNDSICVSDLLSSSDSSDSPQRLSRNDMGVQNLPFCKTLNSYCKPNFCERRAAFKRKFSAELKLTPILKTKMEFLILLFYSEFVHILYKLSNFDFNFPQGRRYKEESKFVLESLFRLNFNNDFLLRYLDGPCINFETPSITCNLLMLVLDILEMSNINIPYIGIKSRKTFLREFLTEVDPLHISEFFTDIDSEPELPRSNHNSSDLPQDLNQSNPRSCELSPPPMRTSPRLELSIPQLNQRYDFNDILNESIMNNANLSGQSDLNDSANYDLPEDIHKNESELVKNFSPECTCTYCLDIKKIHLPIFDEAYLLPPPMSIMESYKLKQKTDAKYNHYISNRIVPNRNDPFISKNVPKYILHNVRRKIHKKAAKKKVYNDINLDKVQMKELSSNKSDFDSLKITYTNLNLPLKQLPLLVRNKLFANDFIILNELNINPLHFKLKTIFGNDWTVFHHEPVHTSKGGIKTPRIFTCILMNSKTNIVAKQIAVNAPATSILCSVKMIGGEIFNFAVSTVYRTHYNSHAKNIGLKIYSKNTPNNQIRQLHNNFYLKLFRDIIHKQHKLPAILCGDFNVNWQNPRPNLDCIDFCRNLRSIFSTYNNLVDRPTNFTHTRTKKSTLTSSQIDSFLIKHISGNIKHFSGRYVGNDGHNILTLSSSINVSHENCFITREILVPAEPSIIYAQAKRAYYSNFSELKKLYDFVIDHTDKGHRFSKTNPFTVQLIRILEEVILTTSTSKIVKIKISDSANQPSIYSAELNKAIISLQNKELTRGLSDRDLNHFRVLSNLLFMSSKADKRAECVKATSDSELSSNDIYALNRRFNPKSKLAMGKTGDYSPDELMDYYLKLNSTDNNLQADESLDIWPDLKNKLSIADFDFKWEGSDRASSLKKCLLTCKPYSKGKDSVVCMNLLRNFPQEYAHLFVWMHECNIKSGKVPDYVLNTRCVQIPKLSHSDLSLISARRFINIQHVAGSMEGKKVSHVTNRFLEQNKVLSWMQHGFRAGHSCSTALATFFLKLNLWPKKQPKIGIFLDSTNAFGVVNNKLLRKVIGKISEGVVKDYLCSLLNQQTVVVMDKGMLSRSVTLKKFQPGVPQGRAESPTLFSLFINELGVIFDNYDDVFPVLYADDLALLISKPTMMEAIDLAKDSIKKVEAFLTKLGIKTNLSKSNFMVFGKPSDLEKEIDITLQNESLTRVKVTKHLGLRFKYVNFQIDITPQLNYLVKNRFVNHRGLVNAVLYSKNRINMINLTSSLYYGQFQFSLEVWPRLSPQQGNRINAELIKPICDIYGLGPVQKNGKKHNYMELFCMTGLNNAINTQDRAIICFANSLLTNEISTEFLKDFLIKNLIFSIKGIQLTFNSYTHYFKAVTICAGKGDFDLKRLNFKTFPGNMPIPFKNLPKLLKAHFGSKHFNNLCKVYFKQKCPHSQLKSNSQCKNCRELDSMKLKIAKSVYNIWQNSNFFSIHRTFFDYNPNILNSDDINIKLQILLNRSAFNTVPFFPDDRT